jgi:plasmid stabilization system protein ParE
MSLEYHPGANRDAQQAISEYERDDPVVAAEFTEALLEAEADIERHPLRYALADDAPVGFEVRERVVRRFPFRILYLTDSAGVLMLAVAHHHRRPGYWHERLANEG